MLSFRRAATVAASFAVLAILTGCAGSVAAPDTVAGLPPATKASLKIAAITDEAAPGVAMTGADLQRILDQVKADITAAHPGMILASDQPSAPSAGPNIAKVKIVFTQYDDGNAFARFMLMGLGQIHIDGDVIFTDAANGQQIAEYKVSKDFAFGGIYGGTTRIEDVEKGFALSVAAILETQQSGIAAKLQQG